MQHQNDWPSSKTLPERRERMRKPSLPLRSPSQQQCFHERVNSTECSTESERQVQLRKTQLPAKSISQQQSLLELQDSFAYGEMMQKSWSQEERPPVDRGNSCSRDSNRPKEFFAKMRSLTLDDKRVSSTRVCPTCKRSSTIYSVEDGDYAIIDEVTVEPTVCRAMQCTAAKRAYNSAVNAFERKIEKEFRDFEGSREEYEWRFDGAKETATAKFSEIHHTTGFQKETCAYFNYYKGMLNLAIELNKTILQEDYDRKVTSKATAPRVS